MLEVKNISKEFTKRINKKKTTKFFADSNISFNAKEGEIVGILGPNGAGKTTLLRIIAGIIEPTEGEVLFDKVNVQKDPITVKKELSFLSGNTKLYKDISPYEFIEMCGHYYGLSDEEIKKRIQEISKRFRLDSFLHQRIGVLSTGQYQRASIARCIIQNPKYYIFDEPTSGLDVLSSRDIIDFIKEEKNNKKCILYSTHYMEEAESICDKIVMINKGKVIFIGTPKAVKEKTKTTNLRDAFITLIEGEENEED